MLSAIFGWIALALIPATAITAWALRRAGRGSFLVRMRPHFVLGYASVAFTVAHLSMTMGAMGRANADGIWLATFALLALCLQAFVGTNLQSPGVYRAVLRRWHLVTFALALALALGHVVLNFG